MSLEDESPTINEQIAAVKDRISFLIYVIYNHPYHRRVVDPLGELTALRAVLSRLEQDAAHSSASSPVEGMAAPGDTVKQSAADVFVWLMIRYKDEIAAGYYINAEAKLAEFVTAAEDGATQRERERCAQIAKKYRTEAELERHKAPAGENKACWLWAFDTSNAIERDIRALTTEATPGED